MNALLTSPQDEDFSNAQREPLVSPRTAARQTAAAGPGEFARKGKILIRSRYGDDGPDPLGEAIADRLNDD
ncbi:MAG: hypothetical protein J0G95_08725 [Rhizobiales bacterium]|nr:hypothetical protein [Hyphomicrobiales bacterium]